MLTPSELLFTECFLAELKQKGFSEFPIGNETFERGVENVANWLISADNRSAALEYDLNRLFSRVPLSGRYSRFMEALGYLNGRCLSLKNPQLIKANIEMSRQSICEVLEEAPESMRSLVRGSAEKFTQGAELAGA